ncbi:acetate/propionate family kinase [Haloferula chungangensis]|uniref:Acetate kinase n=1 Tax=Haloferula chungangensis TaxID=1048331 RepID=A0ABW2L8F2_9BACT
MLTLIINCGSSSVKLALFERDRSEPVATAMVDRVATDAIEGSYRIGDGPRQALSCPAYGDHAAALDAALSGLRSEPALHDLRVSAVGHRIVHGGQKFSAPALVDPEVLAEIRALAPLAPVHAIPNALGIEAATRLFPGVPQVAVFDTAFHQSIAPEVYRYAIPDDLYERFQIRRYGFHGTSHAYVAEEAARRLGLDFKNCRLISAHLGNGCSATAVLNGESVDTSMGLTPLEGLVMGTRSGNVDPNLHNFLAQQAGLSLDEITDLLNRKSGLTGLSGISNDLRVLTDEYHAGNKSAKLAVDVFCFRLARELAGLTVALGGMPDALIFTGGIGENSCLVRGLTLSHLSAFNFELDPERNKTAGADTNGIISSGSGPTAIVVPTNEEFAIAHATAALCPF